MLFFTAIVFALGGFINAIFANKFDDITIVPTFILAPMIYLGGVFYSTALLPEFWAKVSLLNPVLYMVNGFRYGILGVSDVNIGLSYAMLVFFIVAASSWAMYLMTKAQRLRQ